MLDKKDIIRILVFLVVINSLVLVAVIYPKFTGKTILEQINVTRVIDGDTFESGAEKYRLLGLNTPEKGELGYQQAKDFLSNLTGKQVGVETASKDKYGRNLAYLYAPELINEQILKLGLASLYYYGTDNNYDKMEKAEEQARKAGLGIWKRSSNYGCIELVNLKYQEEERCKNQEQLVLNNKCKKINIVLKDDATHIYDIGINPGIFSKNFSCIWNDDGDSVYIWDKNGLVLWYRYG